VKKRANLNRVKRDRLQILAEAVEIEKSYGPILELHEELRPEACEARAKVVARPEYEDTLADTFGDIVAARITSSDVYAFLGLRDRTAIGKYTRSTGGGINPIMERLGWKYAQVRKSGLRVWAFEKGNGAGWLRAAWPHGTQAPAEIEPDAEVSPNWRPEYSKVVTKVVTGGCDGLSPCGSSVFNTVTTCHNLNGEVTREEIREEGDDYVSIKVCSRKVETPTEERNFTCSANELDASQPSTSQPCDTRVFRGFNGSSKLCDDGCSDFDEVPA